VPRPSGTGRAARAPAEAFSVCVFLQVQASRQCETVCVYSRGALPSRACWAAREGLARNIARGLCVRAGEWAWVPDLAALAPAMGHSQLPDMCCCCPTHGASAYSPWGISLQSMSSAAATRRREKRVAFRHEVVYQSLMRH